MAAKRGGAPVIIDGTGGFAGAPTELARRRRPARPHSVVGPEQLIDDPRFGIGGAQRHRTDCAERAPQRVVVEVDGETYGCDRDDHRIAGADLQERLWTAAHRNVHRDYEFVGLPRGLLGADEELVPRDDANTVDAMQ